MSTSSNESSIGAESDEVLEKCSKLYDSLTRLNEKIGGTAHIALGRAYEQCGGINQSAFHWDLIKDLREEGQLILDGKVVMQNGTFLI